MSLWKSGASTCIKSRAERDGKVVSVAAGVLSVDNVAVFSLKDGKLNNHVSLS